MQIITLNVNGIRAGARKGFFEWMLERKPDVVCLQETKAKQEQLSDPVFAPPGYYAFFHDAIKPGYSGVALYTRVKPRAIHRGLGFDLADHEGRYIQADFENLCVASLYLPSGTSGNARQLLKYDFMARYEKILQEMNQRQQNVIIGGDWNIAHRPIDLKNWQQNQDASGFLPEERAWLDKVFGEMGWVDAFRVINQNPDQYTWWSNFGRAWDRNVGWRIDYQVVTPSFKNKIRSVEIYKDQRFSDHAPLIIEYEGEL